MGIVIDFPSRDAACSSRRPTSAEHQRPGIAETAARVVILPVIRIERYEQEPAGLLVRRGGEPGRKRKRRATRP
jgi:hypothetical protein